MNGQNKNISGTSSLTGRLAVCADKAGGKRALASVTGISEAQLFRYINGESEMPASRLHAVATASNVDPGWLLTGTGSQEAAAQNRRPEFRPQLLQQLSQTLDEVLIEYPQRISLRLKSRYISFIYDAVRHEEMRSEAFWESSRAHMVTWLDYLTAIRDEEGLHLFQRLVDCTVSGTPLQLSDGEADELCALLTSAITHRYNGPSGEVDFRQLTQTVHEVGRKRIMDMLNHLALAFGRTPDLSFLDIGCGNGRDLLFIHSVSPQLSLAGIDVSKHAIALCQKLEQTHKIPLHTAREADFHSLPFEDASFHGIQMRLSLPFTPYLRGHNTGAPQVVNEIRRVLKPGGLAFGDILIGEGCVLVPYIQLYSKEDFLEMIKPSGLELVQWIEHSPQDVISSYGSKQKLESYFQRSARFILRKKA